MVLDLEDEVWVSIVGYEGSYEVSNCGRVKALLKTWNSGMGGRVIKTKPETLISETESRGYRRVVLTKNGIQLSKSIHRLVALAFIPNPENKPEVNHKNGIKSDNGIGNLEWATAKENQDHAYATGLSVSKKRGDHSQAVKVHCDTLGLSFNCMKDAADALGLHWCSVWKVCVGRIVQVKGLTFRYL